MPVSTLESIGPIHLAGQERHDMLEIQRSISIKIIDSFHADAICRVDNGRQNKPELAIATRSKSSSSTTSINRG